MKLSSFLIVLNIICLVLAILWWYFEPDFEPAITTIGLIAALISQIFISENKRRKKTTNMTQKSGNNSTNIQVGRDYKQK